MTYAGDRDETGSGNRAHTLSERHRRLRRLETIARVMDTAFVIPGTGIRFGADSIVGLIPGAGDLAGAAVGLAIVNEARRLGVPRALMAKMIYNVAVDTVFGAVPLLGDLFDLYFKSHRKNVQLVLNHFGHPPR